jgi:hypothetical protein
MSSERYNGPTAGYDSDPATGPETDPTSLSDFGPSSGYGAAWTSLKTALFAGDLFAGEQYEGDFW